MQHKSSEYITYAYVHRGMYYKQGILKGEPGLC